MAKRFTDSNKYKKRFIRNLPSAYKIFWDYIICNCDGAGIWHVDFDVAKVETGEKSLSEKKAVELFKDKIILFDNNEKWFIPSFIEFQYGELKEDTNSKPVLSIIKQLKSNNLYDLLKQWQLSKNKGYPKGIDTLKDSEQEQDREQEQEQEKDSKNFLEQLIEKFSVIYREEKSTPYKTSGKDKKAVSELLQFYKQENPDADSTKCLSDFEALFRSAIIFSKTAKEFYATITLSKLNFNLNDYITLIKNGSKQHNPSGNGKYNGVDVGKYERLFDQLDNADKIRQRGAS